MTANAIPEARLQAQARPAAAIPFARSFYWAVRRELWENRLIYLAPLGVGALFLFGFAISSIHLPQKMRAIMALDPIHQRPALAVHYDIASGLAMLVMMVVGTFYCLDALYGERRERSTLFWKSLPVSDTMTVLAKASIPYVVLPLIAFAVAAVIQLLMLLVSSAVLAASGQSAGTLWTLLSLPRMLVLLLYHLLMGHVLWHAPFYAWFLMVSAWARRTPFVWAFLPPIAVCFLEKIVFNSTHFLGVLQYRLEGNGMDVLLTQGRFPIHPMTQMTPLRYLSSAGLWTGLVVAAAFLIVAIRLRRYRGPI